LSSAPGRRNKYENRGLSAKEFCSQPPLFFSVSITDHVSEVAVGCKPSAGAKFGMFRKGPISFVSRKKAALVSD